MPSSSDSQRSCQQRRRARSCSAIEARGGLPRRPCWRWPAADLVLSAAAAGSALPAGRRIGAALAERETGRRFPQAGDHGPPQGAELGKAEVFHLTVRDKAASALALVSAVTTGCAGKLPAAARRNRREHDGGTPAGRKHAHARPPASTGRVAEMKPRSARTWASCGSS